MKDPKPPGGMWQLYKMGGITPAINSMFNPQNAQQMAFIRSIMKEQRQNSLYDVTLNDLQAVVFDLETTGFSPYNGDEIISIGAVVVEGREVKSEETFYSNVNPKRNIPTVVEELTGITNQMGLDAPELIQALRRFLEFVQKRILIAHGTGHDKQFLNSALWKTSKTNLTHRVIDTMMIAKWLHPKRNDFGLDGLLDHYEIEIDAKQRHHALGDSLMTAKLWCKFMKEMENREVSNLGELYTKLSQLA
jgi:DNA polymerase III subunit epsilon